MEFGVVGAAFFPSSKLLAPYCSLIVPSPTGTTKSDRRLEAATAGSGLKVANAGEEKDRKSEHKKTITVNRLIALREQRAKIPLCRDVFGFMGLG